MRPTTTAMCRPLSRAALLGLRRPAATPRRLQSTESGSDKRSAQSQTTDHSASSETSEKQQQQPQPEAAENKSSASASAAAAQPSPAADQAAPPRDPHRAAETPAVAPPSPAVPPAPPAAAPALAPLPLSQRLGPLTWAGRAYSRSQARRPYVTQFVSTLIIYFCGDLGSQYISKSIGVEEEEPALRGEGEGAAAAGSKEEEDGESGAATTETGGWYNPMRALRAVIIGGVAAIPVYKWFIFLSKNFNYASHLRSIATKVFLQQTLFAPTFNSYFFASQSLLSGDSVPQALERVRVTVPPSLVNSLKLWPAVTAFSFSFVPQEWRSLFQGSIAMGWQTYLSYLNRTAEIARQRLEAEKEGAAHERTIAAAATVTAQQGEGQRLAA